jgi:hypothetical protein
LLGRDLLALACDIFTSFECVKNKASVYCREGQCIDRDHRALRARPGREAVLLPALVSDNRRMKGLIILARKNTANSQVIMKENLLDLVTDPGAPVTNNLAIDTSKPAAFKVSSGTAVHLLHLISSFTRVPSCQLCHRALIVVW